MRKITLALTLFIISLVCSSQTFTIRGKVIDLEDEMEIPYVNIYVLNQQIGTSSNSSGFFELELNNSYKNDTLVISSTGYQSRKVAIGSVTNEIIKLNKQIYSFQEISISPLSPKRGNILINPLNGKHNFVQYSPVSQGGIWIPSRPKEPTIEAFFFPFKEKYLRNNYIKEVWLDMSNYKTTPSFFLLRLLRPDKFGKPGEDMITKPIKIEVLKNRSTVKVDISKYSVSFSEDGIFVGVELLIIDENKCMVSDRGKKLPVFYSPFLNYTKSKEEVSYWLYSGGVWNRQQKKVYGGGLITRNSEPDRYLMPSISMVIRN